MKQYKLWLVVIIITTIAGLYSITSDIPIDLQEKETNAEISQRININSNKNEYLILNSFSEGFSNFCIITKDLLNTIAGNESQFESGFDVLIGKEDIEHIKNKQNENQTNNTISEHLSDTTESQSNQNLILIPCDIINIIDGDTLLVDFGDGIHEKIRLIGIDTPESVHADSSKNTKWGNMASDHTKTLVKEGQVIYLEYDKSIKDIYERTLAYVWLSEDITNIQNMLNAKILTDGYAVDKVYITNDKYANIFNQLRITAQNNKTGLWQYPEFQAQ